MHKRPCLDFDGFCELLLPYGVINSPSGLHGLLCGKLCGGIKLTHDEWLHHAWDFLDVTDTPDGDVQDEVALLWEETVRQLDSESLEVQLLLPENTTHLDQRTQALSQWCHGFLSGFGSAGTDLVEKLSDDAADALKDMAEIVQATVIDEDNDTEQEQSYADLMDYVRLIVMHFYVESHP